MNSERLAALIILVGLALQLPSLGSGFFTDDYSHQLVLDGVFQNSTLRPWSLYDFGSFPQPGERTHEVGGVPWWTSPDWSVRFFRPLTSLTLWLDHALYGKRASGYHLSSLLWYAGLLVLLYFLYRQLRLPEPAPLLAVALFCAGGSTVFPVAWPANRNTLLEVFFTVASLLVLTRYRVWGRNRTLLAALSLAALGALSKASGITAFVIIALYLLIDTRGERRRWGLIAAAASLTLALGYLSTLATLGFGTHTLFYATPWKDTAEFAVRLAVLLPTGAVSLLGPFPLDLLFIFPRAVLPAALLSLSLLVPCIWLAWKHVSRHPSAGFLLGWTLLSLAPQAVAPLSDRLLFGASVGSAALLALFIRQTLIHPPHPPSRPVRTLAVAVLILAGPLSALSVLVQGLSSDQLVSEIRETILLTDVGPPALGQREVFLLQSPIQLAAFSAASTWAIETEDYGVRFWPMQFLGRSVRWSRIDETTFELESLGEPFLTGQFEKVFRTKPEPPPPGTRFQTALFTVQVIESDQTGVLRFRVRCPESLDTPRYRFLQALDGPWKRILPPDIGQSIDLPPAARLHPMLQ